jgi:hypothetical protein
MKFDIFRTKVIPIVLDEFRHDINADVMNVWTSEA